MAVDPFRTYPFRTSKGGGTKCTTCEVVTECGAAKCVFPLICPTVEIPGCEGASVINANIVTGTVQYDCDLQHFDLSIECNGYVVDLLLTYELVSGVPAAVLRSDWLGIEESIPFSDTACSRNPLWDFSYVSTRPYDTISIGQAQCINTNTEECTAGRCLPRYLCANLLAVSRPDEPYPFELEWYEDDSVVLPDNACCNQNTMPSVLISRVRNYASGCTCMGPQRVATAFYTAEQSGYSLVDSGALLHLEATTAYPGTHAWVDGYPYIPEGALVWESVGEIGDLVKLCPAPDQEVTDDTREIYGRQILWLNPETGRFGTAFETVDYTSSQNYGSSEYETPYNLDNPFSNVYVFPEVDILSCNPFTIRAASIREVDNCQSSSSVDGEGLLEIITNEFQGWVGPHPIYPELRVTLYSERVNTPSPPQTLAQDCYPRMHFQATGLNTFKRRKDYISIDEIWPDHVWLGCTFTINATESGTATSIVEVFPKSCTGCTSPPVEDPYEVDSPCCATKVPRTLYLSAVQEQYCPCADDVLITLTYSSTEEAWLGSGPFGTSCPCTVDVDLRCSGLIGGQVWSLRITPSVGGEFFIQYNPLEDPYYTCDPFLWITRSTSNDSCCNPSLPASQFHWIVSE